MLKLKNPTLGLTTINQHHTLTEAYEPPQTMTTGKIDVTKIDKTFLFKGKAGIYLDVALIPNKNGRDQYGNDGMIVQSISKQARQEGKKGPILGNYVVFEQKSEPVQQKKVSANDPLGPEDDIPF